MTSKPLVCVDFDGVLNDYEGWRVPNYMYKPLPGTKEFLKKLSEKYTVGIFSTRDPFRLRQWLELYHIPYDEIVTKKVPALAYIDDRALRFDGNYDKVLYELERFKTHWEKEYRIIGDDEYTNPEIDEDGERFQLAYESKKGWWAINDNGITLWKEEVVYTMNELHKKNERFESMLNDFIRTERTEIGKSVLKQLKEALKL